jgi:hypothetical protein
MKTQTENKTPLAQNAEPKKTTTLTPNRMRNSQEAERESSNA